MNKLKEEINKVIPNELKVQLKELVAKFNEAVVTAPTPTPQPVQAAEMPMVEVKTKDGVIMQTESLEVGKQVKQVTPDGIVDVADGDYELETGEIVTVVGGVISDIKKVEAPMETPEAVAAPNAEMESLKATVAQLSEMVAKLSSQVNEQHSTIGVTLSAINSIIEQPAAEPIQKPTVTKVNKQFAALESIANFKKHK